MNHHGYFKDSVVGQAIYRCIVCSYDTFQHENMLFHAKTHPPVALPETDMGFAEWFRRESTIKRMAGRKITIGLLTWNTREYSILAAKAIVAEISRLLPLDVDARFAWVDNGSTDGTVDALRDIFHGYNGSQTHFQVNLGQSIGRNEIIANAMWGDYLMMVDGDISIIPMSAYAMAMFLDSCQDNIGCVGAYCYNCTDDPQDDHISDSMRKIEQHMIRENEPIAWTQYGMFKVKMFKEGILFDEAPCFQGYGWGFEDDDLFRQMKAHGYRSVDTRLFTYYHGKRGSSLLNMDKNQARKIFEDRRSYMLEKWKNDADAQYHLKLMSCAKVPSVLA